VHQVVLKALNQSLCEVGIQPDTSTRLVQLPYFVSMNRTETLSARTSKRPAHLFGGPSPTGVDFLLRSEGSGVLHDGFFVLRNR
jgi:hypothetical protein